MPACYEYCNQKEHETGQANNACFSRNVDVVVMSMAEWEYKDCNEIFGVDDRVIADAHAKDWMIQKHVNTRDPMSEAFGGRVIGVVWSSEGDASQSQLFQDGHKVMLRYQSGTIGSYNRQH